MRNRCWNTSAGCIGQEDSYRQSGLTAEEIARQRNSLRTKDVIGRMRSFLNVLTSKGHPPRGDLMEKAVNYLKNFWNQLFAYLKVSSQKMAID